MYGVYNVHKNFVLTWRDKPSIAGYCFVYKNIFTINLSINFKTKTFVYYIKPYGSLESLAHELFTSINYPIKRFKGKNQKETIKNLKRFVAKVSMSKIKRIKQLI